MKVFGLARHMPRNVEHRLLHRGVEARRAENLLLRIRASLGWQNHQRISLIIAAIARTANDDCDPRPCWLHLTGIPIIDPLHSSNP